MTRGWPGDSCLAAKPVAEQAGINSEAKREAVVSGRPRVEACDRLHRTRPAETPGGCRPDRTRSGNHRGLDYLIETNSISKMSVEFGPTSGVGDRSPYARFAGTKT